MRFWRSFVPGRYGKGRKGIWEIQEMKGWEPVHTQGILQWFLQRWIFVFQTNQNLVDRWYLQERLYSTKPATTVNPYSSWIWANIYIAYLSTIYAYAFFCEYEDALRVQTLYSFVFGFVPGIALCQNTRNTRKRNTTRKCTRLKPPLIRIEASWSAACLGRLLDSTTCRYFPLPDELFCPARH